MNRTTRWKLAFGAAAVVAIAVAACDYDAALDEYCREHDCGTAPGRDAGADAGKDDAGNGDAGSSDAGLDAGEDAGTDAGVEAGPTCNPDAGDPPDDLFFDANCDGIDGELVNALFVDALNGSDDNLGIEPGAALKTIRRALEVNSPTRKQILVLNAEYTEPETLTIAKEVTIAGGYVADGDGGWVRTHEGRPVIAGASYAVRIQDAPGPVRLDRIDIRAADANAIAEASVALSVVDATQDVTLTHVALAAGMGGPGEPGTSGATGATGGPGLPGTDGGMGSVGMGAPAVTSSCGGGTGGAGGNGGTGSTMGSSGSPGNPGGQGGGGGATGNACTVPCSSCTSHGSPGQPGKPGPEGDAGAPGPSGKAQFGTLDPTGRWLVSPDARGGAGGPGAPGGGGGGG
ncbi:MAG: hypothetical protein IRZ16_14675, partial [Myxococcaceae bacterium]|nr:hypothetical protein [Myxococcaceae bacterium]